MSLSEAQPISFEEQRKLIHEITKLSIDDPKYLELAKKIPVAPEVAKAFKHGFGAAAIRELEGFDFSEVEKKYGKDWLTQ